MLRFDTKISEILVSIISFTGLFKELGMAELLLGLKPRQVKTFPLRRTSSESTPSSAAASAAVSVRRTYQTSASSWLSATTDFSTESSTTRNTSCTAFCRRLQPPPRTTTCDLASMIDSYLLMLVISWTVTLSRGSCTKTPMLIRHYKWAMLCFSFILVYTSFNTR